MTYVTREREGSLFANERKEKPDQPDYRGKVRIGGVLYHLSGWERRSNGGVRWLALKADPEQRTSAESVQAPAPQSKAPPREEFDTDIPF